MGPSQLLRIEQSDAALGALIEPHAKMEPLGGPFGLAEGVTWIPEGPSGFLAVSDLVANVVYRVAGNGTRTPLLDTSAATTLDIQGRLLWVSAADGVLRRLEKNGTHTELAPGFEGKRFEVPNDLVVRSDGTVFLIDAVALYGVMGVKEEVDEPESKEGKRARKRKERAERKAAAARVKDGKPAKTGEIRRLLTADELGANSSGLALSPDEKYLYVGIGGKKVNRYEVHEDGTLGPGSLFAEDRVGFGDGMKTDRAGNLYSTSGSAGPGLVRITSPSGKLLGKLHMPVFGSQPTKRICATNLTFGNLDGKTLFVAACEAVYKVRLKAPGPVPGIVIRH